MLNLGAKERKAADLARGFYAVDPMVWHRGTENQLTVKLKWFCTQCSFHTKSQSYAILQGLLLAQYNIAKDPCKYLLYLFYGHNAEYMAMS
jgi:hypothetical protein